SRPAIVPRRAQRIFQPECKTRPLHWREERADAFTLALAPERELAPVLGRVVHFDPHPVGIERQLGARALRRDARDVKFFRCQTHTLFALCRERAGGEGLRTVSSMTGALMSR